MIESLRQAFNAAYSDERYNGWQEHLKRAVGVSVGFRLCETPIFISAALEEKLFASAREIVLDLMRPEYLRIADAAIPEGEKTLNESPRPEFIQVDFALVEHDGNPDIRLIELQGFPSLYGFQELMGREALGYYRLDGLRHLPRDLNTGSYYNLLRKIIVGGHDPKTVVLLEVEPRLQKTLPDFIVTEQELGIETVDITKVVKRGKALFYTNSQGRECPIHRIYNRAIFDEIQRKNIALPFSFSDELDVEWVVHPNWYYKISKFAIPYINHPSVPKSYFLNTLDSIPYDLNAYVLKPLYSFAGSGVIVSPTKEQVESVSEEQRGYYLLQEKVEYAGLVQTPHGGTKAELRVMMIWDDEGLRPVNILVRMGRGALMGVDFNKNLLWVGSACALVQD